MISSTNRALLGLARVDDECTASNCLRGLSSSRLNHLAQLIRRHRVIPQAYAHLKSAGAGSVDKAFVAQIDEMFAMTTQHFDRQRQAQKDIERADIPFTALKGFFMAPCYEWLDTTGFRQVADVDALISSESWSDDLNTLIRRGYEPAKIRIRSTPGGEVGIAPLSRLDGGGHRFIDLHIGAFPGLGDALTRPLPSADVENAAIWQGVVLLMHASRQGMLRLRDVNDFYVLGRLHPGLPGSLREAAREHRLSRFYRAVAEWVQFMYGHDARWSIRPSLGIISRGLVLERRARDSRFPDKYRVRAGRLLQIGTIVGRAADDGGCGRSPLVTAKAVGQLIYWGRPYSRAGSASAYRVYRTVAVATSATSAGSLVAAVKNALSDRTSEPVHEVRLENIGRLIVERASYDGSTDEMITRRIVGELRTLAPNLIFVGR